MKVLLLVTLLATGAIFCDAASTSLVPALTITTDMSTETPETSATSGPTTIEPSTSPSGDNESTTVMPVSLVTMTSEEPPSTETTDNSTTGSTVPPSVTTRSSSITTGTMTTPKVQPTAAPKKSGFEGASFGGGIALGLGVSILGFIVYRVYTAKRGVDYNKI